MDRVALLIFSRFPEPGHVKTRFVPPLSPEQAATLHQASLRAVCQRIKVGTPCGGSVSPWNPILVVTPDNRKEDLRRIVDPYVSTSWAQGEGDLGQRLSRAARRALDGGAECVVLLGSDSPTLPLSYLREAAAKLSSPLQGGCVPLQGGRVPDAVLGPCEDGGYYLIALRRPLPSLFERIDWGGDQVTAQTRQRAAANGVLLGELPVWYDLDRFSDLPRALNDLAETTEERQPACKALYELIHDYLEGNADGRSNPA